MGAKPYPAYRDSSVEWIGEIPEHWEVVGARRVCKQVRTKAIANDQQLSATQKYGVIPQSLYSQLENSKLVAALGGTENFIHVEIDNYVISLRSFQGGLERCMYSGCVSPAYTVLELSTNVAAHYFQYLAKSIHFISALQSVAVGIREGKTIGYEQLVTLLFPVPNSQEQKQIAVFLDHETSNIDTLIEKQQQLINLLKEKRGSLISHTVTKGLNPNTPMKDSGVEWIGEIPEHWEVGKIGNVSRLLSTSESNGDYTVALENIEPWTGNYLYTDSEYASSGTPFEQGDVLFGKLRPYLAKVYLANSSGLAIGDLFTLRTTSTQAPEFFALWLRCREFIDIVDGMTYGAKMPRVSFSQFKVLPIPSPPLEEQKQIASFLDAETSKIDTLIEKANQSIALLKERRSSLISAAVTGKIDVRGVA